MIADFHFLRPWCLLCLLPLSALFWLVWRQRLRAKSWAAVCDAHLLTYLLRGKGASLRHHAIVFIGLSALFAILALAGPAWLRLPVPGWRAEQPLVVMLDMSGNMNANDLKPNRLSRAKFKLHDFFTQAKTGQFGFLVFTGQPFVVSPLTEDGKTIDALLQSITPDIMPVGGYDLSAALEQGAELIREAGFNQGKLLVLTASPPEAKAEQTAARLARQFITTSVMPVLADQGLNPLFRPLARAGMGQILPFTDPVDDMINWMQKTDVRQKMKLAEQNNIPVWRDEGRWFLLPALIFLLPVFRRGWLLRMDS